MGTDELTRIHELAKRVTLLEKMVLRQQSRIDELMQHMEKEEHAVEGPQRTSKKMQNVDDRGAAEDTAVRTPVSVSDLLDEEMKREMTRAYTGTQNKAAEKKPEKPPNAMQRAAGSYARAGGGREPAVNDQAKQTEAARKKTAEATLAGIPQHELRERTPEERTADFVRDYNALYDVPGTMFQKKKAQDDFIRDHEVQGMRCTNMQLRHSRPELEPRFVAVTPTRDADYWGMPLGNNLFAVVPNPFLVYGEEMHTAGGMREAFNSNYRLGNTYG
ncbi:MAG: hypothetical protein HXO80_07530, partial [Selenomonas sp.]|nr:hypothetical protein [Selenomonas sp.]